MQDQEIENLYENMPGDVHATFFTKEAPKFRVEDTPLSLLT